MSPADSQPELEYPYAARPAAPSKQVAPPKPLPLPLPLPMARPPAGLPVAPTWLALLGLAALFALVNLSIFPLIEAFDDDALFIICGCVGIMLAEGFVLAAWLVWGGGSFLKRFVLHWAAVSLLGAIWLVGAIAAEGVRDGDIRDALEVIPFSLPLASLTIQLPLWIVRLYFGWRLVDECADAAPIRPLAIRDLMIGTVVAALSLASARLAEGMLDEGSEGWLIWAILAPSLAGISLVSVLPVAVWLLRMRDLSIGLVCIPIQTTIAILVTVTIIAMNERINLQEVLIVATIITSFAATLSLAALAARAAGFRLKTDRAEATRA